MTLELLLQIIKEKIQFYSETDDRVKWILEGLIEEYEKRQKKINDDNNPPCCKCDRKINDHPVMVRNGKATNHIMLFGAECAWNPDEYFRPRVIEELKKSGYNVAEYCGENKK